MFELKILELAKEYKENRDAYMRVRAKTKKKIRAFEQWLCDYHLVKSDIMDSEQKYFDFCDYCKEPIYFACHDFNLSWSFEIECRCERARQKLAKEMRERIKEHKKRSNYEMPRLF